MVNNRKRIVDQCPQCGSEVPMERQIVFIGGAELDEPVECRNSWHPAQAFPVPEDSKHMRRTCGPHCGVKDNMSGHCDCKDCHKGYRAKEGLQELASTIGLSVKGVNPT